MGAVTARGVAASEDGGRTASPLAIAQSLIVERRYSVCSDVKAGG